MKTIQHKLNILAAAGLMVLLTMLTLTQAKAADSGQWQFQLAPYAWLAGQDGNVATLPGLPAADINVDFYDDILGNLNGALMLGGEARKGRFGVVVDVSYTDIEAEDSTPGPFFNSLTSRTKSWIVSGGLMYRLLENQTAFLDALAGARYWSVESNLSLSGGLIRPRDISNTKDWVDPVVGLKGLMPFGGTKFFISGFVLIGGFGAGSDFMWDANANIGYQWTKSFATTLGYRYLAVDYEQDDYKYDVAQQGVVLGLSWRF